MNEETIKIIRKDGIIYERKPKIKKLTYKLTLRLKETERNELMTLAKRKKVTYANLVRIAINRYLKEEEDLLNEKK